MGFMTTVCADKGSPGASTLAALLAAAHPNKPVLVEADPAGGDLAQRLFVGTGRAHASTANLLTLASDSRRGAHPDMVTTHAAMTPVGVPMVEGLANADQQVGLLPLWPTLCAALVASERDVIADLGRVSSAHPGLTIATHSQRVLIVVRPQLEELVRLRDRVRQLLDVAERDASRLLVVVISPDKMAARDQRAASRILADAGLHFVQVVGFPFLPKEVAAFYTGTLTRRGYLWRTAVDLAASLQDRAATDSPARALASAGALDGVTTHGETPWITS
jgi:hypothetical protein